MNLVALSAEFDEQDAAFEAGLRRKDADNVAVDAREAADDLARKKALDLEERTIVNDAAHERHDVVSLRRLGGNDIGDVLRSRRNVERLNHRR